jgi:zinc transporter ZupT
MVAVVQASDDRAAGVPTWALVLAPLVLLALAIWGLYMLLEKTNIVRAEGFPPVEELSVTRTVLRPGLLQLHMVNGGPAEVTIAQIQVDEAYWNFEFDPKDAQGHATLAHLQRGVATVPYPWVIGEALQVALVSKNGVKFPATIDVAVESPRPTSAFVGLFTLLGLLVGVVPVFLGLIWYPVIRRLGSVGIDVLLCGTLGLLIFLAVDAGHEAIELIDKLPSVYGGAALFVLGVGGSILVLAAIGDWLQRNRRSQDEQQMQLSLALLIAVGIGLHNMAEGLAIGAAYNSGLIALGTALVIGFTIHNVTEGLAIVAPLARVKTPLGKLLMMGCIAGGPTILGAYIGGFTYSKLWSLVFLAVGAGAIVQVVYQISRQMAGSQAVLRVFTPLPNLAGLAAGFMIMYATKLFVAL